MVAHLLQKKLILCLRHLIKKGVKREDKVSFQSSTFMHFTNSKEERGVVTDRDFLFGLIMHEIRLGTSTVVKSFPAVVAYLKKMKKLKTSIDKYLNGQLLDDYVDYVTED